MTLKINVSSTEDIEYKVAILLAPASNYSDGQNKGFRPAIRWALCQFPNIIIRSGMMNIKDVEKQSSESEAITIASNILISNECVCGSMIDEMLETWSAET